jgi:hypothetical protein
MAAPVSVAFFLGILRFGPDTLIVLYKGCQSKAVLGIGPYTSIIF